MSAIKTQITKAENIDLAKAKKILKLMMTGFARMGIATALGLSGCSLKKDSAGAVNTGFKMTGSSSGANVVKNMKPSLMSLLFPRATALTPPVIVDSTGLSINLTSAWIDIEQVEFEQAETRDASEADGTEVEFNGPYAVDLLSTNPLVLDTKPVPDLPYKRIKMKLHKAESSLAGTPSQLVGNSIYLAGTVGGNSFTYQSSDGSEFEIGGANPILPKDGVDLMVSINIANVFKQINLSSLPNGAAISASSPYPGTNLCPSIDPSAADIYSCVRKALEKHGNFGNDDAGNGNLDASTEKVK